MFDLENEIRNWLKTLRRSKDLEDSDIAELESHLRDEIDHQIERGLGEETAFRAALEKSAPTDILRQEYEKAKLYVRSRPFWHPSRIMPSLIWNYTKIALRKIKRQKGFSFINVAGLAIGMAACILILIWVQDELSYDKFHENASQIYRINTVDTSGGKTFVLAGSPAPIGQAMITEIPEVLNAVRVQAGWSGSWYLSREEKRFREEYLAAVDPTFFEIFQFPFIKGNPKTALEDRYSIVLTESMARKYFGDDNPLGQTMTLNYKYALEVTGVLAEFPENSTQSHDFLDLT